MSTELAKPIQVAEPSQGTKRPALHAVASMAAGNEVAEEGGQVLPVANEKEPEQVREEDVRQAVSNLQDYVQQTRRDLQFSVDEESGRTIITVVDAETKEIIRQIPPEETLSIARQFAESEGLLFSGLA